MSHDPGNPVNNETGEYEELDRSLDPAPTVPNEAKKPDADRRANDDSTVVVPNPKETVVNNSEVNRKDAEEARAEAGVDEAKAEKVRKASDKATGARVQDAEDNSQNVERNRPVGKRK